MRDAGATFGGEVSGHYDVRDFYCADSGTILARACAGAGEPRR
jgi:phosphomannomutase